MVLSPHATRIRVVVVSDRIVAPADIVVGNGKNTSRHRTTWANVRLPALMPLPAESECIPIDLLRAAPDDHDGVLEIAPAPG